MLLAHRSGFMPRILGVLLVVAGLGYLTDSTGSVLFQGYSATVGAFTFPGELLLGLWLVLRARSIAASTSTWERRATGRIVDHDRTTTENGHPDDLTFPTS